MTTQTRQTGRTSRNLALVADPAIENLPHTSADLMIRSRSMLLIHEDLAKARIHQRHDEAQLVRQVRIARAARLRRARRNQSRVASAASRARLLVAFGTASR
jgi:hypothetical protein